MTEIRIVFMGTPEFAVASLAALRDAGNTVVAVVTAPDKPAGRGQKFRQSTVKQYAISKGIPVLQPERLKDPQFLVDLKSFDATLQVVVAFRMLPEAVWNMPPLGTVNLHASLLPQYRGAAPINHAIINGETESGVSTFLLQHEIDTGSILFSQPVAIAPADTAGDLHDKLMDAGAALLVKTVDALAKGDVVATPQDALAFGQPLKAAPKIFKEDCLIDWYRPVAEVYNRIRGLSPYPTAYTLLDGKVLKVFEVEPELAIPVQAPGNYVTDGKSFLKFACADGYAILREVQLEGKKRMDVATFLRGYRPDSVTIFS